jgi:hypothetical protein
MSDDIKKLELRITELENQLKSASGAASQIDPEDLKTYQKVSQQLGLSQSLRPTICIACYHCYVCVHVCVCINECVCGPCIISTKQAPAESRFGMLG